MVGAAPWGAAGSESIVDLPGRAPQVDFPPEVADDGAASGTVTG